MENAQFMSYLESPPADAAGVLLLLDFRALGLLLDQVSFHHLLLLSDRNLLPEKDVAVGVQFLSNFQRLADALGDERLRALRAKLVDAPEYMRMSILNEFAPQSPSNLAMFLAEVVTVPNEEDAYSFVDSIRRLGEAEVFQLAQLLSLFDSAFLVELKELLRFPGIEGAPRLGDGQQGEGGDGVALNVSLSNISLIEPEDLFSTADVFQFFEQGDLEVLEQPSAAGAGDIDLEAWGSLFPQGDLQLLGAPQQDVDMDALLAPAEVAQPAVLAQPAQPAYELRMARQPPTQLVYQRIVKPNPTVMMVTGDSTKDHFVRATLVRADSDTEVVNVLEGTLVERISTSSMAQFRRLKIISTSQMQNTLFRLKFSLEVFEEEFRPTGVSIISSPIEVFSHTQYVKPNRNAPTPPVILEVLPVSGRPGTRVAVIGNNFVDGDHLAVRFGDVATKPRLHGPGTLICTAPQNPPGAIVNVSATNDGLHFTHGVPFQYR